VLDVLQSNFQSVEKLSAKDNEALIKITRHPQMLRTGISTVLASHRNSGFLDRKSQILGALT